MYKHHYTFTELRALRDQVANEYGRLLPDLGACLRAVETRIRSVKREQKLARRMGACSWREDAEYRLLRFAAWVLNVSRRQMKQRETPWMNGGDLHGISRLHGGGYSLFLGYGHPDAHGADVSIPS